MKPTRSRRLVIERSSPSRSSKDPYRESGKDSHRLVVRYSPPIAWPVASVTGALVQLLRVFDIGLPKRSLLDAFELSLFWLLPVLIVWPVQLVYWHRRRRELQIDGDVLVVRSPNGGELQRLALADIRSIAAQKPTAGGKSSVLLLMRNGESNAILRAQTYEDAEAIRDAVVNHLRIEEPERPRPLSE